MERFGDSLRWASVPTHIGERWSRQERRDTTLVSFDVEWALSYAR